MVDRAPLFDVPRGGWNLAGREGTGLRLRYCGVSRLSASCLTDITSESPMVWRS